MKKLLFFTLIATFVLFLSLPIFAEDLAIDPDVQEGKVSTEDVGDVEEEAQYTEKEGEELDTSDANEGEASPSMPAESSKSIYFGDVRMYVGYTTLNMSDYNSLPGVQKVNGGLLVGVDIGYKISSYFSIGPKIQFIKGFSDDVSDKHKIDISALPLMGGINGNFFLPDVAMRINIGAYAGYSFASGEIEEYVGNLATAVRKATLSGNAFTSEFELGINFHTNSALSFGISGAYRILNITATKVDGAFTDVIPEIDGTAFDMSGINVLASVSLNF